MKNVSMSQKKNPLPKPSTKSKKADPQGVGGLSSENRKLGKEGINNRKRNECRPSPMNEWEGRLHGGPGNSGRQGHRKEREAAVLYTFKGGLTCPAGKKALGRRNTGKKTRREGEGQKKKCRNWEGA